VPQEESFEVVARSPAPPAQVFEALADIPRWQEWAKPVVPRSIRERDGSPEPNGVGAIRKAGGAGFWVREEVVEYLPPTRLAYVLNSPAPWRRYRAVVELEPDVGGGTMIRWRGRFEPRVKGTGPMLKRALRTMVARLAKGLAEGA
jgi:uncharacterized protein YndB with AHSA1/START domain